MRSAGELLTVVDLVPEIERPFEHAQRLALVDRAVAFSASDHTNASRKFACCEPMVGELDRNVASGNERGVGLDRLGEPGDAALQLRRGGVFRTASRSRA